MANTSVGYVPFDLGSEEIAFVMKVLVKHMKELNEERERYQRTGRWISEAQELKEKLTSLTTEFELISSRKRELEAYFKNLFMEHERAKTYAESQAKLIEQLEESRNRYLVKYNTLKERKEYLSLKNLSLMDNLRDRLKPNEFLEESDSESSDDSDDSEDSEDSEDSDGSDGSEDSEGSASENLEQLDN